MWKRKESVRYAVERERSTVESARLSFESESFLHITRINVITLRSEAKRKKLTKAAKAAFTVGDS